MMQGAARKHKRRLDEMSIVVGAATKEVEVREEGLMKESVDGTARTASPELVPPVVGPRMKAREAMCHVCLFYSADCQ